MITGRGPSGMTVYAWTGDKLLGVTTINSPFEIVLLESLVEGIKVVIYGIDGDGNRTESIELIVNSQQDSNGQPADNTTTGSNKDKDDSTTDNLTKAKDDDINIILPPTGTATGIMTIVGMASLVFGLALKPFGRKNKEV